MIRNLFWGVLTLLLLSACVGAGGNSGSSHLFGGASGGTAGGSADGRNTEVVLAEMGEGTILGTLVGIEMDRYDRQRLRGICEYASSGQPSEWENPDNGNTFSVIPEPAYENPALPDAPCRKAVIRAEISGKKEQARMTACRNAAGEWVLQGYSSISSP